MVLRASCIISVMCLYQRFRLATLNKGRVCVTSIGDSLRMRLVPGPRYAKTESLWSARVGDSVLLPTKICSRVCIGSFCKLTAVSLQGFKKRALRIIFGPDLSYEDTLVCAGLLCLEARRHLACKKFVTETMHASPLYRLISSRVISSQTSFSLRSGPSCHVLPGCTVWFSEFVSVKFAPYIDCV